MPSPLEKLNKFLKLEIEIGYENRAIIGGLDKILPWWVKEARSAGMREELISFVRDKLVAYASLSADERPAAIDELLKLVQSETQVKVSSPPALVVEKAVSKPIEPAPARQSRPQEVHRPPVMDTTAEPENAPQIPLDSPVTIIPGVGSKNSEVLAQIDIRTLRDVLYHFPRRYDNYSELKPINRIRYQDELTVIGKVKSSSTRPIRGGKMKITEAVIDDGTGSLRLTWFNQPYIARMLEPGNAVVVSGKVDMYLGRLVMTNPDIEEVDQDHLHTNRIVPVYPSTARMPQKSLRRIMHQAISSIAPRLSDYLPKEIRTAAGLVNLATAIQQIHFPDSTELLNAARSRLAFDEIFFLQLGVLRQKLAWQSVTAQKFEISDDRLQEFIERLPFELTRAQQKVLHDVRSDLASGRPANRLIQGDVGSGKTIIAALAAMIVTQQDAQAAIMAPTSILAEQHYRNFRNLLSGSEPGCPLQPEEIRLLVGDTSESEKNEIRAGLESGAIKIVVGTHALLEDPVNFNRLQLAVIDEQHRFGVAQRARLRAKGENPHLLVMTATPIPRSLALTIYGDLDLSVIDEMPRGRQPVSTHVLRPVERERAYQLIRSQVDKGRQAFIIYPLVEQNENGEGQAAVDEHKRLQAEVFPNLRLGLLHGRLKPEEKEATMTRFRSGEFDILVSTTVVEVGVDVPNATVMLIEGANRFGLAQLHQLRGRVGRGHDQSYCLLIPETEDKLENERLAVMAETNDGFVLAERDLEQRGPGDFLGSRQAGFADLKLANITDVRLIEKARRFAQEVFERDPDLSSPQHAALRTKLADFWEEGQGDIS